MSRRRLIALDLDGTLLDAFGLVSTRNAAAIRAVADAGHRVVLATGRPPHLLNDVVEALGDAVTHVVGTNGSTVATLPGGEIMQLLGFPASDAWQVVETLRAHNSGFGFAVATDAGMVHEAGFARRMPTTVPGEPVEDVTTPGGTDAFKLFAFHDDFTMAELLEMIPPMLPDHLAARHMGAEVVDIGPIDVDKQSGLAWLCNELGVDADDVIAFGDEANDITMLQWAGRGVAMSNASAEVKAAADEVAPANTNDGVAVVLEWLLES